MNKVIPSGAVLPNIDDNEIGYIIYEILLAKDLKSNENNLAITTSPLYRFYKTCGEQTYNEYKEYCDTYGFRKLNIINFEVKSRFIKNFISHELQEVDNTLLDF